ncbi:hypothetical protein LCGC14_2701500 [marine sediment metagenome]|uniref:Uncharacterized protein n=1 Tax=marine sediment metagenome TaxID=412755 RepID=A0A0F8ZFL8_9ZZZZ
MPIYEPQIGDIEYAVKIGYKGSYKYICLENRIKLLEQKVLNLEIQNTLLRERGENGSNL